MTKQVFKWDTQLTFSTDLGAEFVSNRVRLKTNLQPKPERGHPEGLHDYITFH